jgi:type II secretory pathway pseudopilin PulG
MALTRSVDLPSLADLRQRYRQQLTSAGYLALLAGVLNLRQSSGGLVCLGLIAAVALVSWVLTYQRARAVADVATSRIGSAAQGYVELMGRASGGASELLRSPFSATECVWYRYRVYERDSDNDWCEVERGSSTATFELSDGSGACRVDPEHAELLGAHSREIIHDREKQVEEMLLRGSLIYVLGEFRTLGSTDTALSASADVSALLGDWKKDRAELMRRFDADGNGEIDMQEWEVARRQAIQTVEQQHHEMRQTSELSVVRAPTDGRMFLISTLPPHKLRRRYLWWSFFHLGVAMLGFCGLLWWSRQL